MKCYNFCNPNQDLEYNAPTVIILHLNLKIYTPVNYVALTLKVKVHGLERLPSNTAIVKTIVRND